MDDAEKNHDDIPAEEVSPDDPTTTLLPGEIRAAKPPELKDYDILGVVGRGGMGVVYQARETELDRTVAIKVLLHTDASQDVRRYVREEARLTAGQQHPNIVRVYRLLPDARPPCFVMEWVDGQPINRAVSRLDYRALAALFAKVAKAVAYAHENGVLHLDLKPGNILVDKSGEPKILDFGLARRREETSEAVRGTFLYMAPEQFLSPKIVDETTDVYALGVILYELLTGTKPPAPSNESSLQAWADRTFAAPREIKPDIPEKLQRIFLQACEQSQDNRYKTARLFAEDLDRFARGEPISARPTRYGRLVEERLQRHVSDLALLEEDGLITRRERDAMEHRYSKMAMLNSLWIPGARWLRWGPTLSQLGGWLIVISVLLWPLFYWSDLARWQRVIVVGVPTLVVNLAGLRMWKGRKPLVGAIFCAAGAVLVPIFFGVLFSQLDVFEWRQSDRYEVFPPDYFCNVQLLVALVLMLAYCGTLVYRTRLGVFSVLLTITVLLTYATCTLLIGLKAQLNDQEFAFAACWFVPLIFGLYVAAYRLEKWGMEHLASPPYAVAGLLFISLTCVLAWDIPKTWFKISNVDGRAIAMYCLSFGNGLLYFAIAWWQSASPSRLRRAAAQQLYRLVPPFCVVSLDFLEAPLDHLGVLAVFQLGPRPVYLSEILVIVACIVFIGLAVALQWRWYLYYGLIHLAIKLTFFTSEHLSDYVSWPLALFLMGAVIMFIGMAIELRWGRTTTE
ncbi:MAG: DUF2157 domain-containing protein [Planctomycetota bacterium]